MLYMSINITSGISWATSVINHWKTLYLVICYIFSSFPSKYINSSPYESQDRDSSYFDNNFFVCLKYLAIFSIYQRNLLQRTKRIQLTIVIMRILHITILLIRWALQTLTQCIFIVMNGKQWRRKLKTGCRWGGSSNPA